jgi:phosphohistidine phosphatase
MDLLLWRHAEAFDIDTEQTDDMLRPLTPRGAKLAQRMAQWLDQHLPDHVKILSSPALRCESTAAALGRKYKLCPELSPSSNPRALLDLVLWPDARMPTLVIGHQPTLGAVVAQLLEAAEHPLSVRKGSVWWLRSRIRADTLTTLVHCVQSPEMLG